MPPRGRKRKSDQSVASEVDDAPNMIATTTTTTTTTTMATKTEESPSKRRKVGVTIAQKQALIDNLQLEGESTCWRWSTRRSKRRRWTS